ncbi:LysR family transcriptional regulator [Pararoseomonas indoligenes]|uniref:LysR family transcriptional regulator n=1 Tax=Roseomonas indoligenes TaxID=2820811 RepID=A0A940N8D5_9PROT|nr:LysR family transcriptional regulator [Pararoseomonas indoligenes]MBP0495937.1 LysR family transcriptional regulator [Pararoseomonas indoligenes]
MMRLEGISAFVVIAEAGSISEAARRLRLSKSVVSERLAELERSLGAPLLHRSTRKLALTEDGATFLERASRIVQDVEDAAATISERRRELQGPLRISAPVTFGRLHLGPALYPFLARHPGLELTLDLDDRRVDASADGYDAVVRHGVISDSRLTVWRLAPSRRVLVASPAYLERQGTPQSISALKDHRGIFYTNRSHADWRFVGPGGTMILRGRAALCANNGDMMRDAAIAGLGIALLPTFIIHGAVKAGELRVIEIGAEAEGEFIYVAHPEGRRSSAKLRALVAELKAAFGDPPYWDR